METTNVETEIETSKFRDLRFKTDTRNNREQDRDRKIVQKYNAFLIILKTIIFRFLNSYLKLHFN